MAPFQAEVLFRHKADGDRVARRLRDHGLVATCVHEGRGLNSVRVFGPTKYTSDALRDLALKLYDEKAVA